MKKKNKKVKKARRRRRKNIDIPESAHSGIGSSHSPHVPMDHRRHPSLGQDDKEEVWGR